MHGIFEPGYRGVQSRLPSVIPVPHADPPAPTLKRRIAFGLHRLAFAWRQLRDRRGRGISLHDEAGLVRIHDGVRQIFAPHARVAERFRDGVGERLELVAEKYLGGTGYFPREGDVIVDIGAGIGEFTLWCAAAGARVVAFEPDPLALACLERNTAAIPEIRIKPVALWKERANLRLHGAPDTSASSLIEDGKMNARLCDVEAWPLDQVQGMTALHVIDFMKLDGEGVEPEILAGGARTLRRTRVLAVDVGATDKRSNLPARVHSVLEAMNFRPVPHSSPETILALNTAMVGPVNTLFAGRPRS